MRLCDIVLVVIIGIFLDVLGCAWLCLVVPGCAY